MPIKAFLRGLHLLTLRTQTQPTLRAFPPSPLPLTQTTLLLLSTPPHHMVIGALTLTTRLEAPRWLFLLAEDLQDLDIFVGGVFGNRGAVEWAFSHCGVV